MSPFFLIEQPKRGARSRMAVVLASAEQRREAMRPARCGAGASLRRKALAVRAL